MTVGWDVDDPVWNTVVGCSLDTCVGFTLDTDVISSRYPAFRVVLGLNDSINCIYLIFHCYFICTAIFVCWANTIISSRLQVSLISIQTIFHCPGLALFKFFTISATSKPFNLCLYALVNRLSELEQYVCMFSSSQRD